MIRDTNYDSCISTSSVSNRSFCPLSVLLLDFLSYTVYTIHMTPLFVVGPLRRNLLQYPVD